MRTTKVPGGASATIMSLPWTTCILSRLSCHANIPPCSWQTPPSLTAIPRIASKAHTITNHAKIKKKIACLTSVHHIDFNLSRTACSTLPSASPIEISPCLPI